jgi:hypothetical protein
VVIKRPTLANAGIDQHLANHDGSGAGSKAGIFGHEIRSIGTVVIFPACSIASFTACAKSVVSVLMVIDSNCFGPSAVAK